MPEQFAAGAGGEALAHHERIVGDGRPESSAPADAFLYGLSGGGDRHGGRPAIPASSNLAAPLSTTPSHHHNEDPPSPVTLSEPMSM